MYPFLWKICFINGPEPIFILCGSLAYLVSSLWSVDSETKIMCWYRELWSVGVIIPSNKETSPSLGPELSSPFTPLNNFPRLEQTKLWPAPATAGLFTCAPPEGPSYEPVSGSLRPSAYHDIHFFWKLRLDVQHSWLPITSLILFWNYLHSFVCRLSAFRWVRPPL